jgi:adenine-specific DNA-methyltransferase
VVETDDVVYANYPAKRTHPYEKPPEVLAPILARVCRRGDLVLDPFAGSGSSRVAAEKLGLDLVWRGCDIDPQFAETEPCRKAEGATVAAARGALW